MRLWFWCGTWGGVWRYVVTRRCYSTCCTGFQTTTHLPSILEKLGKKHHRIYKMEKSWDTCYMTKLNSNVVPTPLRQHLHHARRSVSTTHPRFQSYPRWRRLPWSPQNSTLSPIFPNTILSFLLLSLLVLHPCSNSPTYQRHAGQSLSRPCHRYTCTLSTEGNKVSHENPQSNSSPSLINPSPATTPLLNVMHEQTLIVFVIVVRGHLGEWKKKCPRDNSPKSNSLPRFSDPPRLQQSHLSTSCTTDDQASCFPHPLQKWSVLPLLSLVSLPEQPLSSRIYSILCASLLASPHCDLSNGSADVWMAVVHVDSFILKSVEPLNGLVRQLRLVKNSVCVQWLL